jgi:hypothetical protein
MPTKLGEHCTRCGAKCSKRVVGEKLYYECPNRHGIQLIEDAPKEPLPETPEESDDRVDDVGESINRLN